MVLATTASNLVEVVIRFVVLFLDRLAVLITWKPTALPTGVAALQCVPQTSAIIECLRQGANSSIYYDNYPVVRVTSSCFSLSLLLMAL